MSIISYFAIIRLDLEIFVIWRQNGIEMLDVSLLLIKPPINKQTI